MDISKILSKLKNKYKDLGFSEDSFKGVAAYLATTLGDDASDEDIDNGVAGVEALLNTFNGDADRRATAAAEKAKKEAAKSKKPAEGGEPDPQPDPAKPTPADMPEWAKGFAEQMKTLAAGLSNMQAEKTAGTRKQKLEAKLKDAPELFAKTVLKHFKPETYESDEAFNTFLEEVETDAKEAAQELSNQGLSSQSRPYKGTGGKDDKVATAEEVKEVVDQIM